jgi:hypothetical protein
VNSVPSKTSQRVYRRGVEQFFDWWGAAAAGEASSHSLMQGTGFPLSIFLDQVLTQVSTERAGSLGICFELGFGVLQEIYK